MLAYWLLQIAPLAAASELSEQDYAELGRQIFANECASRMSCLISWNDGEDFPSLGIGHFIWYREGQSEVFEQTFPALLEFLEHHGTTLPEWLQGSRPAVSPWQSREQFEAAHNSPEMDQLRQLLATSQNLQARFIAERFLKQQADILAFFDTQAQPVIEQHLNTLASADAPYGLYALIDYVHFKGTGLHPSERYRNHGWGLAQVLQAMPADRSTLDDFVAAAEFVLRRRVANAPTERNEERWLTGWINRLQTYLPESQTFADAP